MSPIRIYPFPVFEPGERVLASRRGIWWASGMSLPSYRVFFPLPPIMGMTLYVTDRRVMVVYHLLGLLNAEFSQWFPCSGGDEVIVGTCAGKGLLLGPFLEIVSERERHPIWRSRRARLRYCVKSPEALLGLIPATEAGSR